MACVRSWSHAGGIGPPRIHGKGIEMSAIISDCEKYRYWLERGEKDVPYVAWVLANPSTADASLDDPTVRKGRGFSERIGFKRFVFVNVLAYRATDPQALRSVSDPVGPLNENYLREVAEHASRVIVAWGGAIIASNQRHIPKALALLRSLHRKPIMCLGYTAANQPRHPLMLAYSTKLEEYNPQVTK